MYELESLVKAFDIIRNTKTKELQYKNPTDQHRGSTKLQTLYKDIGQDLYTYLAIAKKIKILNSNIGSMVSHTQNKLQESIFRCAIIFAEKTKISLNSLVSNSFGEEFT